MEFYLMAFSTGLLGSGHCMGMCGGLVAALGMSPQGRKGGLGFQLSYSLGRILTYVLVGVAVGWLGSSMTYASVKPVTRWLLLASDVFVILIGLGSAGLFRLNFFDLECKGPTGLLTQGVGRLRTLPAALSGLPIGLLMGFLPCGFLYAMLITAAQTTDPVQGGITMLLFGLGTAPALILFGTFAHRIGTSARIWMVRGAGVMVVLMGAYNLMRHLRMLGFVGSAMAGHGGGMGHMGH